MAHELQHPGAAAAAVLCGGGRHARGRCGSGPEAGRLRGRSGLHRAGNAPPPLSRAHLVCQLLGAVACAARCRSRGCSGGRTLHDTHSLASACSRPAAEPAAEWIDNPSVSAQEAVKILVHQIQQTGPISEPGGRVLQPRGRDPRTICCRRSKPRVTRVQTHPHPPL